MAFILALAGLITVATIAAPAVLSFGLTLGTLFAGAALVESRFGKRSVRNRK
jgi:ABC-type dipeptide/oligopeptide/nickel transport system permease component